MDCTIDSCDEENNALSHNPSNELCMDFYGCHRVSVCRENGCSYELDNSCLRPESKIINNENRALTGQLTMKLQRRENGNWVDRQVVVDSQIEILENRVLGLGNDQNYGWDSHNVIANENGFYRVYASFEPINSNQVFEANWRFKVGEIGNELSTLSPIEKVTNWLKNLFQVKEEIKIDEELEGELATINFGNFDVDVSIATTQDEYDIGERIELTSVEIVEPPVRRLSRPNIIVILTDDEPYGSGIGHMPERDRLASTGVIFNNAYVTVPLCCPSRASILTGNLPERHGIFENPPPNGGAQLFRDRGSDLSTIATWLDDNYNTAYFGKYLNSNRDYSYIPPGWDFWYATVDSRESGHTYNFKVSNNGNLEYFPYSTGVYSPDYYFDQAENFIRSSNEENQSEPFLLFISVFTPHKAHPNDLPNGEMHIGSIPARRHEGRFSSLRVENLSEPEIRGLPPWLRNIFPRSQTDLDRMHTIEISVEESLLAVDEGIGNIIQALREANKLNDTIIIYTSDNGKDNIHVPSSKGVPYQESIHVPLIISGPSDLIRQGTIINSLALNIDIAPTIAEIANVSIPEIDGRSLVPLIQETQQSSEYWRRTFPISYYTSDTYQRRFRGLVWGRFDDDNNFILEWKYVEYLNAANSRVIFKELFRISRDPNELNNLADLEQYQDAQRRLARLLRRYYPNLPSI